MDNIVERGRLYDYYGGLLTEHQRNIYQAVVYDDMSLSEIAQENGITRQGVHDLIRRCDRQLQRYEDSLGLIGRDRVILKKLDDIDKRSGDEHIHEMTDSIRDLL